MTDHGRDLPEPLVFSDRLIRDLRLEAGLPADPDDTPDVDLEELDDVETICGVRVVTPNE